MWILTTTGFYSIVEKPWDRPKATLTIRARVLDDLDLLRRQLPELGSVAEDPDADYRYRAQAPRAAVAKAMFRLAESLDYDNFKGAVAKTQGRARAHLYGEVWEVLFRLQEGQRGDVTHRRYRKGSTTKEPQ